MATKLTDNQKKRLTYIKYLYRMGVELSKKWKPLCYFSVLTFHDAIELFLILGLEVHEEIREKTKDLKPKKNESILEFYLRRFKEGGLTLSKKGIKRLNQVRNSLKHSGIFPSEDDIEKCRQDVHYFFEENTPKLFDIEFSEIFLSEIVANEEARKYLKNAEKIFKTDKKKAFLNICEAYRCLMKDSEEIGLSDPTIATPDETLSEIERRYKHGNLIKRAIEELAGNIESSLHDALSEIYDILNVLTLGAEYGKYKKFKEIMQKYGIHIYSSKVIRLKPITGDDPLDKITEDEIKYCFDFIVDLALSIQEQQ
jgi:hypothetical protein